MVHRLKSPFAAFPSCKIWRCSGLGPGTLATWQGYGAGNPRLFASGQFASLLKFNLLKLKGCSLKYH